MEVVEFVFLVAFIMFIIFSSLYVFLCIHTNHLHFHIYTVYSQSNPHYEMLLFEIQQTQTLKWVAQIQQRSRTRGMVGIFVAFSPSD